MKEKISKIILGFDLSYFVRQFKCYHLSSVKAVSNIYIIYTCVCIYAHVYTYEYVCTRTYIYIYIYRPKLSTTG